MLTTMSDSDARWALGVRSLEIAAGTATGGYTVAYHINRADTGDFLQPPAFFTRAVPGMDTLLDGHDLCPDSRILASKDVEAEPRRRWNAIVLLISDNLEQFGSAIAALCRDNAELGHMPTDCI